MWNTVEIQGVKKTIEAMQVNSQLDMEIDQISSSTNKLIDNVGHISIVGSGHNKWCAKRNYPAS